MTKQELMAVVGNNVRHYRMLRGMTQEELAIKINKNSSAVTRIEGGMRMMSLPTLRDVASALDVSCDALLSRNTDQQSLNNILQLLSKQTDETLSLVERILHVSLSELEKTKEK